MLHEKRPDLVKEWDYSRNFTFPEEFMVNSGKKVWWTCSKVKHHYWEASIANRTRVMSGCPICSNKKICPVDQCNSLKAVFPDIAKQWATDRNELGPEWYAPCSNKSVWWQCEKEHHVYSMMINNKISKKKGCGVCSGRQICPIDQCNSLQVQKPELAAEWHPTKNSAGPESYSSGSNKKVWWQCKRVNHHEWEAPISNRTAKAARNCPMCAGKKICEIDYCNSFREVYPEAAKFWHPSKNEQGPEQFSKSSGAKAWWKCDKKECHEWQTPIDHRIRAGTADCPICIGRMICPDKCNTVIYTHPDLCKEWDYTKNTVKPDEVTFGSSTKIHWKCPKGHKWIATLNGRTTHNTGCPVCKESKLEKKFIDWATECGIVHHRQYMFKECRHKKKLRYDFIVPEDILVELDGKQHFDRKSYFSEMGNFEENLWKDLLKTFYAIKNNFILVRISFQDLEKFDEIIDRIFEEIRDVKLYTSRNTNRVYDIHRKITKNTSMAELKEYYEQVKELVCAPEKE